MSLSGSHAYGTDVSTSDLDIRGITIERDSVIWGLQDFEQFEDRSSDTVIFGFKKIIKLLLDCNPNALEILAVKDEHVLLSSETGRLLRENIDMFLSRKCILTFGGYAAAQLKRLENALARDAFTQPRQEEHIMQSVINKMNNLAGHFSDYTKSGSIDLYIDDSAKEEYEKEIFMDIDLSHFPLRDFTVILNGMLEVTKQYAKLNHRNRKKSEGSLLKHAMHLIRLLEMGTEVLEGKGLHTFRHNREFLLDIRNGVYTYEELFAIANERSKTFTYAAENTNLPEKADFQMVNDFVRDTYIRWFQDV